MTAESRPVCPRCGQLDAVRKVSSIVSAGVTVVKYDSVHPINWGDKTYFLPKEGEGAAVTMLAQRLQPPSEHEIAQSLAARSSSPLNQASLRLTLIWITFTVTLCVCVTAAAFWFNSGVLIGIGWPIVSIIALIAFLPLLRQLKRSGLQLKQQSEPVMERWNQLYYCARDDGVFIPGQGRFVPLEQMKQFLLE